jgi:hypothetical protein
LAEAAEAVRFERRNLNESSLEYVYLMHVVQVIFSTFFIWIGEGKKIKYANFPKRVLM